MPKNAPGTLRSVQYTEVLAFLLEKNGYRPGPTPPRAGSARIRTARLHFGAAKKLKLAPAPLRIEGSPGTAPKGGGPTQEELDHAAESTHNWLYQTHDYSGSRYVPLGQINDRNAKELQPICVFQVGGGADFQTNPIEYQGTLYITSNLETVALDATNCRPKWKYTWRPRSRVVFPVNRGVAIKDGYVVRGTSDGYLLALNAATGKLIWAVKAANADQGETFTMAPLIYQNLVVIGPAASENGVSGWVGAFRLRNGSRAWKFHTVPGATRNGSRTWGNPKGIKLGGGAVWTPFSLNPKTGVLYVAVTNPAPDFAAALRPGKNLYTDSVVALDIYSGRLLWYEQMVPNDSHDWDLTQVSPLFRSDVGGREVPVMATAGKNGLVRTIELASRKVLYSTPVTTRKNTTLALTTRGVEVCPGPLGGVEWNGPALDRKLDTLYVNAVDWCYRLKVAKQVRYVPGQLYMGGSAAPARKWRGWLTAIDAATGAVRWRYHSHAPMVAAVTATKGNVIFTGELNGDFLALDARNGKVLYRFDTGGPVGGGVVTYERGGRQYVAVMSGNPSGFWVREFPGAPTVVLFALR